MTRHETEDFRPYFSRIRPIFHRLFNIAHAVTGSCDQAEYSLQAAILECRDTGSGAVSSHVFRENLRTAVIACALNTVQNDGFAEQDWTPPPVVEGMPASALIAQESAETQRMLFLKYGCGFSVRRIARVCQTDVRHVKAVLARFETRARRKLSAPTRQRCATKLTRAVNAALDVPSADAPDIGSTFRSFQADASDLPSSRRLPARIVRLILTVVLAAACIAAFWLVAVLLQPVVLESGSPPPFEETAP